MVYFPKRRGVAPNEGDAAAGISPRSEVVSIFETPGGKRRPSPESPIWLGPPTNVVGVVVPHDFIVAQSDSAAIVISSTTVYPTGWTIAVSIRYKKDDDLLVDEFMHSHDASREADSTASTLRYRVLFPDGRSASNRTPPPPELWLKPRSFPETPVLFPLSASGTRNRLDFDVWVWPLPGPGKVMFVCEWPAGQLAISRCGIDGNAIQGAADRAAKLWEDDSRDGPSGNRLWTGMSE